MQCYPVPAGGIFRLAVLFESALETAASRLHMAINRLNPNPFIQE